MKRISVMIIFTMLLFINIGKISAATCEYNLTRNNDLSSSGKGILHITTARDDQGKLTISYEHEKQGDLYNVSDFYLNSKMLTDDNQCFGSITLCTLSNGQMGIFASTMDPNVLDENGSFEYDIGDKGLDWFWEFISNKSEVCYTVDVSKMTIKNENGEDEEIDVSDASNNDVNFVYSCSKFEEMYSDIAHSYNDYGNCSGNKASVSSCRSNALSEVNRKSDNLKNVCRNITQNQGYNATDSCIQSCLHVNNSIQKLRDLYIKTHQSVISNDCSFSDRLIIWIRNIFNWVKYIIPTVVIILGIIDFIRAIASEKDDEMKKAQSRFVKRLISAALIFIVPFVLVFILDKMGFTPDACGIMDL